MRTHKPHSHIERKNETVTENTNKGKRNKNKGWIFAWNHKKSTRKTNMTKTQKFTLKKLDRSHNGIVVAILVY